MWPKFWALFSHSLNHGLDRRESLEDWSPSESSQLGEAGPNETCMARAPFSLASYLQQLQPATCKDSRAQHNDKMDVDGIVPQITMVVGPSWPDIGNYDGTDSGGEDQPLDLSLNRSSPDSSGHSTTSRGSISLKRKSSDSVTSATSGVSSPVRTTPPPAARAAPLPALLTGVSQKRTYTEEELQAALRDIQAGKLGTRRAAVIYGIPRSTLRNKVYKMADDKRKTEQAEGQLGAPQSDFESATESVKANNARGNLYELLKSTIAQKGTLQSPAPSSSGESCSPPLGLGSLLGPSPPDQDSVQLFQHLLTSIQQLAFSGMLPSENAMPKLLKQFSGYERFLEESANLSKNPNLLAIGGVLDGLRGLGVGLGLGTESAGNKVHGGLPPGVGEQLSLKSVVKSEKQLDAMNNQRKPAHISADGKVVRPKRGRYRNYDREKLLQAVDAVQRRELSVHRAGTLYGVPHSTLEYKVKERHLLRPKKRAHKPQTSSAPNSTSPVPASLAASAVDAGPYPWAPSLVPSFGPMMGEDKVPAGAFFEPHVITNVTEKDEDSGRRSGRKSPIGTDDDIQGEDGVLEELIESSFQEKPNDLAANDDSDDRSLPALRIAEVLEEPSTE